MNDLSPKNILINYQYGITASVAKTLQVPWMIWCSLSPKHLLINVANVKAYSSQSSSGPFQLAGRPASALLSHLRLSKAFSYANVPGSPKQTSVLCPGWNISSWGPINPAANRESWQKNVPVIDKGSSCLLSVHRSCYTLCSNATLPSDCI